MATYRYALATFDEALASDEPLHALRLAVRDELERHGDHNAVLGELERMRQALREQGREHDEDVVMDVMDFVVGWCSPHMAL